MLHIRALIDLAIIDETVFVQAWMQLKAVGTMWLEIILDILWIQLNLDL
jgi:hypothetical protein